MLVGLGAFADVNGRTAFLFLRKYILLQNASVLTWNLLCQKMEILLVFEKTKLAAKSVGRQTQRKQLGSRSGEKECKQ